MVVNQWSSRWWHEVAMERAESSSHLNEHVSKFPTSGMMRGSRVGTHLVFPIFLKSLVHLLMSGGRRMELDGSNVNGIAVVVVHRRYFWIISTSS